MTDMLRIIVYSSGFTYATQANVEALQHEALQFTTMYPGGIYGTCSFFVPRSITAPHQFRPGYRVTIMEGMVHVWEGEIDGVVYTQTGNKEGIHVNCTGYFGTILKRRRWDKIWCDNRYSQDVWKQREDHASNNDFTIDRYNRIRFEPKIVDYANNDYAAVRYTMPTGQTVSHISYNYDFSEGAQVWSMSAYDITNSATIGTAVTSTGTGSKDDSPSAGCADIELRLVTADQTVSDTSTVWAEWTSLIVYGESGTISATEVMKDIRAHVTSLSSDESLIGTNTQTFCPLYMQGETIADFITRLAAYGDTSLNPWAVGVRSSKNSLAADYKPVLYFEQQPALTDYDYTLRLEEIESGVQIEYAYDEIANWITLEYTDVNGDRVRVTPDDDANLTDATSVATYGQRDVLLRLGGTGVTEAKIYARRYLAWFKDPKYRLTSSLTVRGNIRTKANDYVPVYRVKAGTRIMIENYLQEIGGTRLIFLITGTRYDEDSGRMTISAGTPDPLEVLAARRRGI